MDSDFMNKQLYIQFICDEEWVKDQLDPESISLSIEVMKNMGYKDVLQKKQLLDREVAIEMLEKIALENKKKETVRKRNRRREIRLREEELKLANQSLLLTRNRVKNLLELSDSEDSSTDEEYSD